MLSIRECKRHIEEHYDWAWRYRSQYHRVLILDKRGYVIIAKSSKTKKGAFNDALNVMIARTARALKRYDQHLLEEESND